ncbi:histone h2b [Anaeramoeba flamelloides]|uniref:Histone h2b n=1 Tax=Anaeramoeba flamelloides TaxID=1746091 RepID=A0ABQ8XI63_9EUKA|nr:histone h2b [Anaeramoeba flamelloides]
MSKKTVNKEDETKKRKRRVETYSTYVYKVFKQVHPEVGISNKAMRIMNSFVMDVFERLALESSNFVGFHKKGTISCREVQSAKNYYYMVKLQDMLFQKEPKLLPNTPTLHTNGNFVQ